MKKKKTNIRVRMASVGLTIGLGVAALTAPIATPAAHAAANDAKIKHSTSGNWNGQLVVCKDWSGTSADPGCKSGSALAYLSEGRTSPWADADGYYKPAGTWTEHYFGGFKYSGAAGSAAKWVKISGCGGCTKQIIVHKY